jgi:predicted DNA-binding transcriptional regulator AlpA
MKSGEVLGILNVHRNTLARWVKQKRFPAPVRPSGTVRFWDRQEVLAWKAQDQRPAARGPRGRPWNRKNKEITA